MSGHETEPGRTSDPRRWGRLVGWLLGASLLAAALVVAIRVLPDSIDALGSLQRPDPLKLVLLPVLVIANLLLTAEIFHLLGRRYAGISRSEDLAIVSGLTLANYLPFRPGIFMRIGYFKGRHEVPVASTVRVLAEAYGITAAVILLMLVLLMLVDALSMGIALAWTVGFLIVLLAMLIPNLRLHARVSALRLLEMLFWALRIHLAFLLLGETAEEG